MNYKFKELLKARKTVYYGVNDGRQSEYGFTDWIERGPGNVTGRVRGLIADPDDPSHNTWYAGSVGGVWKTADGGQSWENLTADLPNLPPALWRWRHPIPTLFTWGIGEGKCGSA
ncbi:MAG: hypothetical protein R3C26_18980 [Calditrichia bacterium]